MSTHIIQTLGARKNSNPHAALHFTLVSDDGSNADACAEYFIEGGLVKLGTSLAKPLTLSEQEVNSIKFGGLEPHLAPSEVMIISTLKLKKLPDGSYERV
jgi:hypothetical protein